MSLTSLKSGTDIRGTAVGENTELTDEAVKKITAGFIKHLCEKTGLEPQNITVAVGHDSRISAERIKKCVISVLLKNNIHVLDCSLASTPSMFMTTVTLGCTASVILTIKTDLNFLQRTEALREAPLKRFSHTRKISTYRKLTVLYRTKAEEDMKRSIS